MDLSKAFDAIHHGISRDACETIISYLINMNQRIKSDDVRNSCKCAARGLPQGS